MAIVTRREVLKVQAYEVIPYPWTTMDRNLLIVHVSSSSTSFKYQ